MHQELSSSHSLSAEFLEVREKVLGDPRTTRTDERSLIEPEYEGTAASRRSTTGSLRLFGNILYFFGLPARQYDVRTGLVEVTGGHKPREGALL